MTMTAQQTKMLDDMMPEIYKHMQNGLSPIEAVKAVLKYRFEFCGEMAMQETKRSKLAKEYMFNTYCKKMGLI